MVTGIAVAATIPIAVAGIGHRVVQAANNLVAKTSWMQAHWTLGEFLDCIEMAIT
jgi:hypothetical protein